MLHQPHTSDPRSIKQTPSSNLSLIRLQKAARAGALCVVVRENSTWEPENGDHIQVISITSPDGAGLEKDPKDDPTSLEAGSKDLKYVPRRSLHGHL